MCVIYRVEGGAIAKILAYPMQNVGVEQIASRTTHRGTRAA
jgi:hypothetical protein